MKLLGIPMRGNKGNPEKTTYKAAKHAVKAIFLVDENCDFEIIGILWKNLFLKFQPPNKEIIS